MGAAFELPLWQNIRPQESKTLALEKSMRRQQILRVSAANYFKANADNALILVIGNEGRGISAEIKALADDVVTIPMAADGESLNAAIAEAFSSMKELVLGRKGVNFNAHGFVKK